MRDELSIFGRYVSRDTSAEHRLYPVPPDWGRAESLAKANGYAVRTFSFPHDPPKPLRTHGYKAGDLWIYDPEAEGGSFRFSDTSREYSVAYTREWRIYHELGHAVSEPSIEAVYGPSRRMGKLGGPHEIMFGNGKTAHVRALTLAEAIRAVAWEDATFRIQRVLMRSQGIEISDADFAREWNVNMCDAVHRLLTGEFSDPGQDGFLAHAVIQPMSAVFAILERHA